MSESVPMSNLKAFRTSELFTHEIIYQPPHDDENNEDNRERYALRRSVGKHRHERIAQQQHNKIKQHYACSDQRLDQEATEAEENLDENNTSDSSLLSFDNGEMKQRVKDSELTARNNERVHVSTPKRIGHVLGSISHCIDALGSSKQLSSATTTTDGEEDELPCKEASKPPTSFSKVHKDNSPKLTIDFDCVVGSGKEEEEETECFEPSAAIVESYAHMLLERSDDNDDTAQRLSDSIGIIELRRSLQRYVALTDRIEDELFVEAPKQDAPWRKMVDLFTKIDRLQRDFESFSKDTSEAVKSFGDTVFHDERQSATSEYLSALDEQSLVWQQQD